MKKSVILLVVLSIIFVFLISVHSVSASSCGDGILDPDETCDSGAYDPNNCCISCQLQSGCYSLDQGWQIQRWGPASCRWEFDKVEEGHYNLTKPMCNTTGNFPFFDVTPYTFNADGNLVARGTLTTNPPIISTWYAANNSYYDICAANNWVCPNGQNINNYASGISSPNRNIQSFRVERKGTNLSYYYRNSTGEFKIFGVPNALKYPNVSGVPTGIVSGIHLGGYTWSTWNESYRGIPEPQYSSHAMAADFFYSVNNAQYLRWPSCPANETILKLSALINAHGEIYSQSNYFYPICYNNIFGKNYNGPNAGTNVHSCTTSPSSNKILNLSANTNAHASVIAYNTPVCYGDLTCTAKNENCNSSNGESLIVSLSSNNNAHLSTGNDYNVKVCCRSPSAVPTTCNNNGIKEAEEQCDGNQFGLPGNSNLCSVYNPTLYSSGTLSCNSCQINTNACVPRNYPGPRAIINSPQNGSLYFSCNSILFNQSSTGIGLRYNWSISDSISTSEMNSSSFFHTYSSVGLKRVILTVTDSSGLKDTDTVSILVINETSGIFAFIDQPEHLGYVLGKTVNFNGVSSFAISNTGAPDYNLSCIGGACPLQTAGPICGTSTPAIIQEGNRGNYSSLLFDWRFGWDITSNLPINKTGRGLVSGSKTYFDYGSQKIELNLSAVSKSQYTFNLFEIIMESGCIDGYRFWDDSTGNGQVLCTTRPIAGVCTSVTPNVCSIPLSRGQPACCPAGYSCSNNASAGGFICQQDDSCNRFFRNSSSEDLTLQEISMCKDYNLAITSSVVGNKSSQCTNDCMGAAMKEYNVLKDTAGFIMENPRCAWINDSCTYDYDSRTFNDGEPCEGVNLFPTGEGQCVNGLRTSNYNSVIANDTSGLELCPGLQVGPITRQELCGQSSLELPFFSWMNAVIAFLLVIIIYGAIRKLR